MNKRLYLGVLKGIMPQQCDSHVQAYWKHLRDNNIPQQQDSHIRAFYDHQREVCGNGREER